MVGDVTTSMSQSPLSQLQGQLVGICGAVGSGKSSLLYALLDQMETVSGSVAMDGSMALVTQQAWIQNATVRDNILFSKSFDRERYDKVVAACSLNQDFEIMMNKDLTEVSRTFYKFHFCSCEIFIVISATCRLLSKVAETFLFQRNYVNVL